MFLVGHDWVVLGGLGGLSQKYNRRSKTSRFFLTVFLLKSTCEMDTAAKKVSNEDLSRVEVATGCWVFKLTEGDR